MLKVEPEWIGRFIDMLARLIAETHVDNARSETKMPSADKFAQPKPKRQ